MLTEAFEVQLLLLSWLVRSQACVCLSSVLSESTLTNTYVQQTRQSTFNRLLRKDLEEIPLSVCGR